ncbi:MAG: hypothetical protein LBP27_02670 [Treponema sp.]|jgi:hypothetical protein|nr:hypothetical protein [Treponema sp.]
MRPFRCFLRLCLVFFITGFHGLGAADFSQGQIKLTLHEKTGHFSLYYLGDGPESKYEALFTDQDPRSSFISLIMNDRIYRLGESSAFRIRTEGNGSRPVFIFESSFATVRETFSFIKTSGSSVTNGIRIDIAIRNRLNREATTGFRLLLDTSLGEGSGNTPFVTDRRRITAETVISGDSSDAWWVSKNGRLSLMGSIRVPGKVPDFLHFANWKRLNDIPWKTSCSEGRNFNFLPYSVGDSAVCYYYEPLPLAPGDETGCSILLASEDPNGFAASNAGIPAAARPVEVSPPESGVPPRPESASIVTLPETSDSPEYSKEADMLLLRNCIDRIDQFVAGKIFLSEEELIAMELTISRVKIRYGLP